MFNDIGDLNVEIIFTIVYFRCFSVKKVLDFYSFVLMIYENDQVLNSIHQISLLYLYSYCILKTVGDSGYFNEKS